MTYLNPRKLLLSLSLATLSVTAMAGPSILDIRHSISDDNVVAPESFETKSQDLRENFFLKNFTEEAEQGNPEHTRGDAREYEDLLSRLPVEIEMPYNSIVGNYIDMYLGKRRDLVADMLALHNYYGRIFIEELIKENLPLELQYLPVIESAINPNAVSRAGAAGLWQFMPATAIGLGLEVNSLVDQRRDPRLASREAAKYLKQLYDIYGDWSLAIAAYNCGPGNVNKALRRAGGGKKDYWEIYEYLLPETRGYVPAFIAANYVMNYYNKYGIRPTLVKQQLVTDTVSVDTRVHFNQIAEVLNIPVEEIRMLNPQFIKDIIPGDSHPYSLVLPSQQVLSYIISEKAILGHDSDLYARRTNVQPGEALVQESTNAPVNAEIAQDVPEKKVKKTHVVGRGENLRDIAKKYGVSATDIKRWNNLRRGKVKEGENLIVEVYERELPASVPATVAEPVAAAESRATRAQAAPMQTAVAETKSDTKLATAPKASSSKTTSSNTATPAKKTQAKAAPAKPAAPKSVTVKRGDTLEKIAKANGTTVAELRKANGMKATESRIDIGQKLQLPAKGTSAAKSSTAKKSTPSKKKSSKRRR